MSPRPRFWTATTRGLLSFLLALLLTIPAWLPWLDPRQNLWEVDDAKNHLLRLYLFSWLIKHGVWYPRWVPDLFLGYGYPVFNFYAPGFYYLALALKFLLRLDFWDAFRASGVFAVLLTAAGVYSLAFACWRRVSLALLAVVTVVYGPYVVQINLFKRGDIPEMLGLALLPWALLALWQLWGATTRGAEVAWTVALAAVGAVTLLTHNLSALVLAAVCAPSAVFLLAMRPRRRSLALAALAGAVALGSTAFFWLPAVGETASVQLEWVKQGDLNVTSWLLDPSGNTPRQRSPENRQTLTGFADLHLHYPHQLVATPKPSLAQALLALLAAITLVSTGLAQVAGVRFGRRVRGHHERRAINDPATREPSTLKGASDRPFTTSRLHSQPLEPVAGPGTLASPTRSRGLRAPALASALSWTSLPLLLIAALCWFLLFTPSAPLWRHIPGLALLQFPWRLLGPLAICLAAGAAGALAVPVDWIERRAGPVAAAGVVALLGVAVVFNGLGARGFQFAPQPSRQINGKAVVADEHADFLGLGTTSGREFLPRDVQIATFTAGQPRGWPVFERLYPEDDWLDTLLLPMGGDLRVLGWDAQPLRIAVRVANDAPSPGLLGVHQARFPGWRLWLDGHPAPLGVAPEIPEQQATPGFMTAAVPPGEHTLVFAFGPTHLRLLGMIVSAITLCASWIALVTLAVGGRWPAPQCHPERSEGSASQGTNHGQRVTGSPLVRHRTSVLAAATGLLVFLALAYATWRGVRPGIGRYVITGAQAVSPQFAGGVWSAGGTRERAGSRLLVNVAEAVRAGDAVVQSPSGATLGPNQFVDVRQLTVTDADTGRGAAGTSRREWLFLHPPSAVAVDVALPAHEQIRFQAALSLDPAMWQAPTGDGVRYQVLVGPRPAGAPSAGPASLDDAGAVVLDRQVNPRADSEVRRWVPVVADLSPWAGTTVRVTLRTLPREDLTYDWSGWANPVVEVFDAARDRPPAS